MLKGIFLLVVLLSQISYSNVLNNPNNPNISSNPRIFDVNMIADFDRTLRIVGQNDEEITGLVFNHGSKSSYNNLYRVAQSFYIINAGGSKAKIDFVGDSRKGVALLIHESIKDGIKLAGNAVATEDVINVLPHEYIIRTKKDMSGLAMTSTIYGVGNRNGSKTFQIDPNKQRIEVLSSVAGGGEGKNKKQGKYYNISTLKITIPAQ